MRSRCETAQNQSRRKMLINLRVHQTSLLSKVGELFRFPTFQYRQGAVLANQAIVQKQSTDRRVKVIGDRIAMQIDHKNSSRRDAAHLAQNLNCAFIVEVMQRQRLNCVIERTIRKWKRKAVALH